MDFISSLYSVSDSWPLDQLPDDVDIDALCKATARAISSEKVEDKDSLAEHIISGYEQMAADEKDKTVAKPDRSVVEFFLEKVFIPLIIELII